MPTIPSVADDLRKRIARTTHCAKWAGEFAFDQEYACRGCGVHVVLGVSDESFTRAKTTQYGVFDPVGVGGAEDSPHVTPTGSFSRSRRQSHNYDEEVEEVP